MIEYIGAGAYIHGVPARDLTNAEAKKYGKIIAEQEQLTGLKLYEVAKKKPAKQNAEGGK